MDHKNYFAVAFLALTVVGVLCAAELKADEPIYQGRVWEITCPNTAGGINLAPTSGVVPKSAFQIKNTSGATIFIAAAHQTVDATTNGFPIEDDTSLSIEGPPANWECFSVAGGAVIELIGGSK